MADDQMMMDGMMGGMMQVCMIAGTLFVLVILVTMIVQAVLQAKILRELKALRAERLPTRTAEPTAER